MTGKGAAARNASASASSETQLFGNALDDDAQNAAATSSESARKRQTARPLLMAKFVYFFFWSGGACVIPFFALFYSEHLKLSPTYVGLMVSVRPAAFLVGGSLVTALADRTGKHGAVLLTIYAVVIVCRCLVYLAPDAWTTVMLLVVGETVGAGVTPMLDAAVLDLLGPQSALYGRQRLWGAVGWGLTAAYIGKLNDALGFVINFVLFAAFSAVAFALMAVSLSPPAVPVTSILQQMRLLCASSQ